MTWDTCRLPCIPCRSPARTWRWEATPSTVTYTLSGDGPPVQIGHHGQPPTLTDGCAETRDIRRYPTGPSRPSRPGANPPAGCRRDRESAVAATEALLLTPRAQPQQLTTRGM